ncbi:MAG: T9SS type A sorting domain-containing protein [Bacteroidales bacterium]|nr:T9SS type A sorting domain-containing protein [Bacteroidales bacterium]
MKKHITLLLLALAVAFGAKAQDATLFMTESDYYVEGWDCVNTSDGCVIFQTLYFDIEAQIDLGRVFYKIDMDGVAVDSVFYADPISSHHMRFTKDPRNEASNLLLKIDNTDEGNFLHVIGISDALELSEELNMLLPGGEQGETNNWEIIIDDYDDIIVYWESHGTDGKIRHFDRIGLDGTVKTVSEAMIDDDRSPYSGTLFCKGKNPLEYGFLFTKWENPNVTSGIYGYTLDSLFKVVSFKKFPVRIDGIAFSAALGELNTTLDDDNNVLLTCMGVGYDGSGSYITDYAMMLKLNRDWDIVSHLCIEKDTTGSIAWSEYACAANPDEIYHVRIMRNNGHDGMLVMSKINSAMEIEWERFAVPTSYGEVCYWVPRYLGITDDGHIVTSGTKYDYSGTVSGFLSIIHDETADVEENGLVVRPYIIYPNPVKNRLSIHFSPDVKLESIEIFDLQGRCVANSHTAEMDVANLPAGQYVAKITLEGGKVYSDKVVKE